MDYITEVKQQLHEEKDGFDGQRAVIIPRKVLRDQCVGNPLIAPLHITDIGYYPKAQFHYRVRPAGVDQHVLIYCTDGKGNARFNKQTFNISAGEFFIIPRQTPHTYRADEADPWTIFWVHFSGSTADAVAQTLMERTGSLKRSVPWREQRIECFTSIYQQLENGYELDNLVYANLCFGQFIASLLFPERFNPETQPADADVIAVASGQMKRQIGRQLTLQQMAEDAGLSVSHFVHLFRKKQALRP